MRSASLRYAAVFVVRSALFLDHIVSLLRSLSSGIYPDVRYRTA